MGLEGSVVVVTGAGRGIGKVLATHFSDQGAAVVLNYLDDTADARGTARSLEAQGRRALAVRADISRVAEARTLVDEALRHFGRLDVIVNNAAIDPGRHFLDVDEELFQRVFDTNVKGTYFCAQAAARHMKAAGGGRIINIGSVHSRTSLPGCSVYAASKGAIEALTRQLAIDLSPFAITANVIAPGPIEVEKFLDSPAYDAAALGREVPLGRVGLPRDVAAAAVFLASPDAAWITGQVLIVDGGTTARLPLYVGRPIPGQ